MEAGRRHAASAAIFLCLVFSFFNPNAATAQASDTQVALQQLTNSLVALSQSADQSAAGDLARQRRDLLLAVAATSPAGAMQFMLPPGVAGKLPPSATPFLERDDDETGTLQAVVEDYPRGYKPRFYLDTGRDRLELLFTTDAPPEWPSGSLIRACGKRIGNALLLPLAPIEALPGTSAIDPSSEGVQVLSLASNDTFGAQPTAVLLVNFYDDTSTPFAIDDVRDTVFDTVSNFDLENSQNQTWLTGNVFGWLTLSLSVTTCPDIIQLAKAVQQAASTAGLDLSSYRRQVFIFPHNSCFWRGLATIGGNPSYAAINGESDLLVIGHEMGHNFGLYHSHSYDCGDVTLGTNCQNVEYGDVFDIMGQFTAAHFNPFQKERLGWLNYGSSQPITTVTADGLYHITPYESGDGPKALKVLRSIDSSTGLHTWYYIEYRQLIGFDAALSAYPSSTAGILIRSGTEGTPNSSQLLNMHPEDPTFDNAALGVGETFVDSTAGVSITTTSADADGATVNVQTGPGGCQPDAPLITVSPAQSAPSSPGDTAAFIVSVTNQDSLGCAASMFLVIATPPSSPAGWSATVDSLSFSLAPGKTASTAMKVTSPAATPPGSYAVSVTTTKWPKYQYTSSATAVYVIAGTVAAADFALTAPSSVSVQQGGSTSVSVSSTVSNGFSAPITFSASGLPAGVTASFSPATLPAPGAGISTLAFTAAASAPAGNYSIMLAGAGGGITHSLGLTLAVTTTPPPPPPPPPPPDSFTLFTASAVPAVLDASGGAPLELGMKFTADRSGQVTGVRFYKGPANLGVHVGSLWTSSGQLLAQAAFASETKSGWQQVNFPAPVAITANTVYVVSYHSTGHYSYNLGYFNSRVDNPPLHALTASNGNGVFSFGDGATFPRTGAGGANFWVDVVFTGGTASLVSLSVSPSKPSIAAGSSQQFKATGKYSDGGTRDLTSQVSWSSATPAVATINSAGLATGISAGSSMITASVGGLTASATLTVTGTPPPPSNSYTLFTADAVPAILDASAGAPVELGMKFTADRSGQITAIRFYKGLNNTGVHVGSLWSSTGQRLAQATFANETASGWQQVTFSNPVPIAANTAYVVSYHSSGHYSYNLAFFNSRVDNPPLRALPASSGNGVFSYAAGSVFPATGAGGANFWVDVVFQ